MQIPSEVNRAAGGLRWEDALQYVAEWARKEALKEAAAAVAAVEAVEAVGWDNIPVNPDPFVDAVRALAEVTD